MHQPTIPKKNEKVWKTMACVTHDGDVPVMKAPRSISGAWVESVSKWKTQVVFLQKERAVGYSHGEVGWRGERLGPRNDEMPARGRKR